ncbi:MAG: SDR family NAD(P)-dependent oxidoreductase [Euryarchaeota archaeon]|nr:SDR family NAD(P)-dependent oxidoreductase [Euryarchaeota archaeon]
MKKILVTGGAGFIGSHLVDSLVSAGNQVRVLDNLEPQVHSKKPDYLNARAQYVWGDVRDRKTIEQALEDIEVLYHQASMVGVGQSMYQIERYVDVNTMATARLLDVLVNKNHGLKKLVVASSMSIYGEGLYRCPGCGAKAQPLLRAESAMRGHEWEHPCPSCGNRLSPIGTPETKRLDCTSIYAQSKKDQEEYCLIAGRTYGIPTVALRYFNVYGSRQSLGNPYTGVCAIFSSRIKNNHRPVVYEDGLQTRDFIHVSDIVRANILAGTKGGADYHAINVGTGNPQTIRGVSETLIKLYGSKVTPHFENNYRAGDVRHCVADVALAKSLLGFEAQTPFDDGMRELVAWGEAAEAKDKFDEANAELRERGLL